jgi:hypothetical protein
MMRTRLCGLVLLALLLAVFLASPAFASEHPWDGTKVTDTLITSNGDLGQNPDDPNGDADSGILNLIVKWFKDRFTAKTEINRAEQGIKQEVKQTAERKSMNLFRKNSYKR